ncbi:MAG: hypothetical protein AB7W16_24305 [Candidatus Obscuribacterales bacterium]
MDRLFRLSLLLLAVPLIGTDAKAEPSSNGSSLHHVEADEFSKLESALLQRVSDRDRRLADNIRWHFRVKRALARRFKAIVGAEILKNKPTCLIEFTIDDRARISEVQVVKTSGNAGVAYRALKELLQLGEFR